jgi:hypothetical protein
VRSTQQFGRVCQAVFGTSGAQGLEVSELRISFTVIKTVHHTPNAGDIRIYNLSQAHENQIKGEFDSVLLNVGYQGATRLLLRGNIRRTRSYRDGNDRVLQVICGDGDSDYRNGVVNTTLAAGTTDQDLVDHIVSQVFETTTLGSVVLSGQRRIRGAVFAGMARHYLHGIARNNDAHWSIQDGQLQIVPVDSTLPTEAVVLRSDTGLLNAPEVTDKGITAKCLLNPQLCPNGKVWLDNNDLKELLRKRVEAKPGARKNKPHTPARLDPDGIYKILKLTQKGDTRGPDWYSESLCVSLGKSIPTGAQAA